MIWHEAECEHLEIRQPRGLAKIAYVLSCVDHEACTENV